MKALMAVTGIILIVFLLMHMVGNLKMFMGAESFNHYAEWLKGEIFYPIFPKGSFIWLFRLVLVACIVAHMYSAWVLTVRDRAARGSNYVVTKRRAQTYSARTMRWGGPLLLLFIVYHLLHFTVGAVHPDFVRGDVYHNVVIGFQNPLVAFFYVLSMLALSLHLFHGVESMLQTVGLSHPRYNALRSMIGAGYAAVVAVGNLSFPLSVFFGLVR